jgi:hypothetical protein
MATVFDGMFCVGRNICGCGVFCDEAILGVPCKAKMAKSTQKSA